MKFLLVSQLQEMDEYRCLVSVVGYVSHGKSFTSSKDGVGKSCLCCRFTHPSVDNYVDDHPSLLALHELESSVVCTDSFLYWGSREILFHTTGKGKGAKVKMEVVEHTLFYYDETSTVFPNFAKLQDVEIYTKQALAPPESESSRKISYYSRDCIGFPGRYPCQSYPSNVNRIARGFVVVIDVSVKMPRFKEHLSATQQIVHRLSKDSKHPLIVAATKRDVADSESLQMLVDWASKKKITIIETSAKENINVDGVFSHVASKILKSAKLPDNILSYSTAAGVSLEESTRVRTQFKRYLKQNVRSSSTMLSTIENSAAYLQTVKLFGKFKADEMYACHLLEMRDLEVKGYPGALDNPDMRMEMLELFVENIMLDLVAHKRTLRSLISVIISSHNNLYVKEERLPNQATSQVRRPPPSAPKPFARIPAHPQNIFECFENDEHVHEHKRERAVAEDKQKKSLRDDFEIQESYDEFQSNTLFSYTSSEFHTPHSPSKKTSIDLSSPPLAWKHNKEMGEKSPDGTSLLQGASLETSKEVHMTSPDAEHRKGSIHNRLDPRFVDKLLHLSPGPHSKMVPVHPSTGSSNMIPQDTERRNKERYSPFTLVSIKPNKGGCEIVSGKTDFERSSIRSTRRTPLLPPTSSPTSISTQKQLNDCQSSADKSTENSTQATAVNGKPTIPKIPSSKLAPERQKARLTDKPVGVGDTTPALVSIKSSFPDSTSPNPEKHQNTVPAIEKPRTKPKPIKPKPNIPKKPSNSMSVSSSSTSISEKSSKQVTTKIKDSMSGQMSAFPDAHSENCKERLFSFSDNSWEDDLNLQQPTHQKPLNSSLEGMGSAKNSGKISLNQHENERRKSNQQTGSVSSVTRTSPVQGNLTYSGGRTRKAMSLDSKPPGEYKPRLEAIRKKVERAKQEQEKLHGVKSCESNSAACMVETSSSRPPFSISPPRSVDMGTATLSPPERCNYDSHTLPCPSGLRTSPIQGTSPTDGTSPGRIKNYFDTFMKRLTGKEKDEQKNEKVPKPKQGIPLSSVPDNSCFDSPPHDYEPIGEIVHPTSYPPKIAFPQHYVLPPVQYYDPLLETNQVPYILYPMGVGPLPANFMYYPHHTPLAMFQPLTSSKSFDCKNRRPYQSRSIGQLHHLVNSETDKYKYEKPNEWISQTHEPVFPPHCVHPMYPNYDDDDDDVDVDENVYDYADMQRGIRSPPTENPSMFSKLPPRKFKPRAQTPPLDEEVDEYMDLVGDSMDDDDYENAETINMQKMGRNFGESDVSSTQKIIRHGSMDDIRLHSYYNLEVLEEPQADDQLPKKKADISLDKPSTKPDSSPRADIPQISNNSIDEETGQTSTSPKNEAVHKVIRKAKALPPRDRPRPNYKSKVVSDEKLPLLQS